METVNNLGPWAAGIVAILVALTPWVLKWHERQAAREDGEVARLEKWLQNVQNRLDDVEVEHRKCELEQERLRGELALAKGRITELETEVKRLKSP